MILGLVHLFIWVVHFEKEKEKFVKKLLHAFFLEILPNPQSMN
jgi:hypothetical protein